MFSFDLNGKIPNPENALHSRCVFHPMKRYFRNIAICLSVNKLKFCYSSIGLWHHWCSDSLEFRDGRKSFSLRNECCHVSFWRKWGHGKVCYLFTGNEVFLLTCWKWKKSPRLLLQRNRSNVPFDLTGKH